MYPSWIPAQVDEVEGYIESRHLEHTNGTDRETLAALVKFYHKPWGSEVSFHEQHEPSSTTRERLGRWVNSSFHRMCVGNTQALKMADRLAM